MADRRPQRPGGPRPPQNRQGPGGARRPQGSGPGRPQGSGPGRPQGSGPGRPQGAGRPNGPGRPGGQNRPPVGARPQGGGRPAGGEGPRPKGRQEGIVGEDRLQKILAHAGIGSRRACEELILQGRISVDGKTVRELGTKVDPNKVTVALDGQKIRGERHVYFAIYKPKGYVSTNNDPSGRPRVVDLLPEIPQRVYTVGRLDEASTGLMLLTNDGELANKLAHPKFGVEKIYRVVVAGTPTKETLDQLVEGIWLAEGKVRAKRVRIVGKRGEATILEMVLAEGKNREVRRMLAKLGNKVMTLTRVAVGPISIKGLSAGEFRPLTGREIEMLQKVAAGEFIGQRRPPEREGRPDRAPRPGNANQSGGPRPQRPGQTGTGRRPLSASADAPRGPVGRPVAGPSGMRPHPSAGNRPASNDDRREGRRPSGGPRPRPESTRPPMSGRPAPSRPEADIEISAISDANDLKRSRRIIGVDLPPPTEASTPKPRRSGSSPLGRPKPPRRMLGGPPGPRLKKRGGSEDKAE